MENVWESWPHAVNVLNFHPGKAGFVHNAQCNYADPCLQHLNTTLDQPRLLCLLISMFCESTDLRAIPSFRVKIAVARCRWSQKTSLICRSLSPCVASKVRVACQEPCGECLIIWISLSQTATSKQKILAHLEITFAFSFSSFLLNSPWMKALWKAHLDFYLIIFGRDFHA